MKVAFCLNGLRRWHDLNLDQTVLEQKESLAPLLGHKTNEFCLYWNDQMLEDAQTFRHYNIQENDIVYIKLGKIHIVKLKALLCELKKNIRVK